MMRRRKQTFYGLTTRCLCGTVGCKSGSNNVVAVRVSKRETTISYNAFRDMSPKAIHDSINRTVKHGKKTVTECWLLEQNNEVTYYCLKGYRVGIPRLAPVVIDFGGAWRTTPSEDR